MKRFSILAAALSVLAIGCGTSTPTSSSSTNPTTVKFTATLLPSNEVPAVTNADASGRGTVTATLNLTRDSTGTITSAKFDYTVDLNSFPAGTTLTAAHIHPGAAGVNGAALISMNLGAGEIVLVNGSQTGITKTGLDGNGALTPAVAQDIINNPASYYFNVHTTINTGGAARGQLVKQ
jgi:CHRD domain-containing protein